MVVPQVISSKQANTTTSDGKVLISGDNNEVVVSAAREAKITLVDKKSELESVDKKCKELSRKFQVLDKRMLSLDKVRGNQNAMNQTIQTLFKTMEKKNNLISRKLQTLDKQMLSLGKIKENLNDMINQTIQPLSKTVELLDKNSGSLNKSTAGVFAQLQAISQRLSALERQANNYALQFPRKGTSDYVILRRMPSFKAVTVCLWMKTTDKGNRGTPLDYAVPGTDEELLLFDYRKFTFYVGNTGRQTSVSANDRKWHHICATWENTSGSWKLYKDGKVGAAGKGLKTGHVIRGGGALVLGQEQDAVGGSFDANQCFIGEMTGVNIWDHVIGEQEIKRMSRSCMGSVGNVFRWPDFKAHLKGSVKIIKPSC